MQSCVQASSLSDDHVSSSTPHCSERIFSGCPSSDTLRTLCSFWGACQTVVVDLVPVVVVSVAVVATVMFVAVAVFVVAVVVVIEVVVLVEASHYERECCNTPFLPDNKMKEKECEERNVNTNTQV